jgi:hypothetical protein
MTIKYYLYYHIVQIIHRNKIKEVNKSIDKIFY